MVTGSCSANMPWRTRKRPLHSFGFRDLSLGFGNCRSTCLPCEPRIGTERGIYPAGTPAPETRVGKSRCPFANPSSSGRKVRAPIAVPGETVNTYLQELQFIGVWDRPRGG